MAVLVSALVEDCDDTGVVDDAIPEDIVVDVGDEIGLVVRRVEELVGSKESLVDGGTLLGAAVVGATEEDAFEDIDVTEVMGGDTIEI